MKLNYEKPEMKVLRYKYSAIETVDVSGGGSGSGPIELPDLDFVEEEDNPFSK